MPSVLGEQIVCQQTLAPLVELSFLFQKKLLQSLLIFLITPIGRMKFSLVIMQTKHHRLNELISTLKKQKFSCLMIDPCSYLSPTEVHNQSF